MRERKRARERERDRSGYVSWLGILSCRGKRSEGPGGGSWRTFWCWEWASLSAGWWGLVKGALGSFYKLSLLRTEGVVKQVFVSVVGGQLGYGVLVWWSGKGLCIELGDAVYVLGETVEYWHDTPMV